MHVVTPVNKIHIKSFLSIFLILFKFFFIIFIINKTMKATIVLTNKAIFGFISFIPILPNIVVVLVNL